MRLGVANTVKGMLRSIIEVDPSERKKLFYLTITFFFVIAAYTIIKELKDSIFVAIVGRGYIPTAKIASMIVLIPAILFYSFLVDKLRRYQLIYVYSILYGVLGLIFTYLLSDSVIGLGNTQASPYRLFGWILYFFVEGYSPFVVSLFWAFANSVTRPDEAKKNYGLMVSGSKMGGMVSAALAWLVLSASNPLGMLISTDIGKHQFLLGFASIMVLLVAVMMMGLMKNVSGRDLHGYEAAYAIEKKRSKEVEKEKGFSAWCSRIFSGLALFVKYPYLLGIFCMVFFYEVINTVLSYKKLEIAQAQSSTLSEVSSFLFVIIFWTHLVGFVISFLGTKTLMNKLGERRCLILVPVTTGILLIYSLMNYTQFGILCLCVAMRAINYGFSYPVRESLYIPTVKEIKFKSKSWIDSFGSKFAKSTGSTFNSFAYYMGPNMVVLAEAWFFGSIIAIWIVAAYLLGKRFEKAVARNEVIGADAP